MKLKLLEEDRRQHRGVVMSTDEKPKSNSNLFLQAVSTVWHMPGGAWRGAIAAGPLRLWLQFGAALVMTGMLALVAVILWLGPWSGEVELKRVDAFALLSLALCFVVIVCIVGLMDLRLNFSASKDGLRADMGDAHEVQTTTTTTTAVTP